MADEGSRFLSARVTGASRVKAKLAAIATATGIILSEERLEKLLLRRTLDRFLPAGANPRAQKGPDGKSWKAPSKITLERRRGLGQPNRALYATATLMQSIAIVRTNMRNKSALASPTGAGFSIGVKPSSKASKYARIMNFGGITPQGKRIPARRFLGISKDDVKAVEAMMARTMNRSL